MKIQTIVPRYKFYTDRYDPNIKALVNESRMMGQYQIEGERIVYGDEFEDLWASLNFLSVEKFRLYREQFWAGIYHSTQKSK